MKDEFYLVRRLLLSGEYDYRVTVSPDIFADVVCELTEYIKDYSIPVQEELDYFELIYGEQARVSVETSIRHRNHAINILNKIKESKKKKMRTRVNSLWLSRVSRSYKRDSIYVGQISPVLAYSVENILPYFEDVNNIKQEEIDYFRLTHTEQETEALIIFIKQENRLDEHYRDTYRVT
jgi:hypothetical protein